MREETAREFYELLEHAHALLSKVSKTKGSLDDTIKIGAKLIPGAPQTLINAMAKGGAMKLFRSIPEPNEEEKAQLRTMIGDLPFSLRKALIQVGKSLPYKRGKKTPRKLETAQGKKDACDDVARILPLIDNLEAACKQVGKKYGASSRTIRRIYYQYRKALKSPHSQ